MTAKALWYADGLRWIGSLFQSAADRLEQPSLDPAPGEPLKHNWHADLFDTRHRMHHLW